MAATSRTDNKLSKAAQDWYVFGSFVLCTLLCTTCCSPAVQRPPLRWCMASWVK